MEPSGAKASVSAFRRVFESSAWLIGSEVGVRILSFATIVYLSRVLTTTGMGVVEYGMAIFNFVRLVTAGGSDMVGMRQAARNKAGLGRLAGTIVLVAWTYFTPVFGLLAVAAWFMDFSLEMKQSILLFGLTAVVLPLGVRFAFVARERVAMVGIGALAGQLLFLALCFAFVQDSDDALRVAYAWLIAMTLRTAVQAAAFRRQFGPIRFRIRLSRLVVWLRSTLALGLASVARNAMQTVDVLLLGVLVVAGDVASYALALKLPQFLVTGVYYFHQATFPTLARLLPAANQGRMVAIQADIVRAALGAALPGLLCLTLISEPLIILLFTEKFSAAADLLPILLLRFPIVAVSGLMRNLVWIGRPDAAARVAVQGLVTALVAVAVLVPVLGARGAAYGMVLADVLVFALYTASARSWLEPSRWLDWPWLARLAAVMAAIGALSPTIADADPVVAIVAALATWTMATLLVNYPFVRRLQDELRARGRS